MAKPKQITINGITDSLVGWARKCNLDYEVIRSRYKRGARGSELLVPKKEVCKLTINGITKTIGEWADITGISSREIRHRLSQGWKTVEAIKTPVRSKERLVMFRGKMQSIMAWAKEIGIGHGTLSHRLNSGWSVQRALTTPVCKKYASSPNSISQCAKRCGLNPKTVANRIRHGMTKAAALSAPIRKGRPIEGSINSLAKEAKISAHTLWDRFHRQHLSIRDAISTPIHDKRNNSLAAKARVCGMCPGTVWRRIKTGWEEDEALTTPVLPPVTHICQELGVDKKLVHSRMSEGWSLIDAISIPGKAIPEMSINHLARENGLNPRTVHNRLGKGVYIDNAVSLPPMTKKEICDLREVSRRKKELASMGIIV